jgi:hypothetical protein
MKIKVKVRNKEFLIWEELKEKIRNLIETYKT